MLCDLFSRDVSVCVIKRKSLQKIVRPLPHVEMIVELYIGNLSLILIGSFDFILISSASCCFRVLGAPRASATLLGFGRRGKSL
jgi:hypothetical protein